MIYESTKKLTLSAMFFAVGLILPFFIGQIPMIGQMLLPMHIPVLLCGLIVGWQYGLAVGFFLPLVRSVLFGMPAMFPNAVSMAFELAAYGLVIGWLYGCLLYTSDIWLKTNLEAHDFIPGQYWTSNYEAVKKMLPQAEVYVYEDNKIIQGFVGVRDEYRDVYKRQDAVISLQTKEKICWMKSALA